MTAENESEGSEHLHAELNVGLRPNVASVAAMREARDVVGEPVTLEDLSAEMQRQRRLAENQEAFKSTSEEFERHGLRLKELIAGSDYSRPRSAEDQGWLDAPPVGAVVTQLDEPAQPQETEKPGTEARAETAGERWIRENWEAIQSSNEFVERYGLILEKYCLF